MNSYESLINVMLDGRYKLTRIIGAGGMAVVYEADDLSMNRKVAVKMLKDEIREDIQEVKRFVNESRAVAMLSHPNIVHIYDVSLKNTVNGQYIVMELIDGITLKDYIIEKGRLSWRETVSYAEKILNALNHAHGRGIIHRDVKPQNIMLLKNGNLKITDFGIAKMQGSEPLTMTDKAIGTVHYISPEQANGTGVTNVSDIYSVGVLIYEMTTGRLPFEGDTAINVAMKQISEIPKNPREINREIPKGLSQIILKAMNKSPKDRYQNAGEMIKQLSILFANPATVFNNIIDTVSSLNNINNSNNLNQNGSNLPVAVNGGRKTGASLPDNNPVGSIKGGVKTEITPAGNDKIRDIDKIKVKIDEDEMRRRGRNSKKGVRRRSSRSWLPIISGATIAFLIVTGVSIFNIILLFMDNAFVNPSNETVVIGDYTGKLYNNNLISEMERERLVPGNITYATNDSVGAGRIISQLPEPEEVRRFRSGTDKIPVNFVISQGRDTYIVEDWTVREFREAEILLRSKRISLERIDQSHDTIPSGFIIYTEPSEGTIMNTGDVIHIYVSTGQEIRRVIMPGVVGETEENARRILAESDIAIRRIDAEYSEVVPAGRIIEQDIVPFREVPAKSTRVVLKISLGPRGGDTAGIAGAE
ncbi:MAG: Stk1 family PASTA domain-containing Ser/Thr kinase [Oscillospiraceae bacterium]|nr:Stk1 family PASTA domain-containing Ser/Thr kinase [Oscillospiraceae bacterium]